MVLKQEREHQDDKWGLLDNINDSGDFLIYVRRYLRMAEEASHPVEVSVAYDLLMKAAAICIAALEKFGVN